MDELRNALGWVWLALCAVAASWAMSGVSGPDSRIAGVSYLVSGTVVVVAIAKTVAALRR